MLIQIHILQSYAPSNLNRDENNSPKQAVFGGYTRGRISSQCLKRAIRTSDIFEAAFGDDALLAQRTKDLPELVKTELEQMKVDPQIVRDIVARVKDFGKSEKGKDKPEKGGEGDEPDADQAKKDQKKSKQEAKAQEDESELKTRQLVFLAPNEVRPFAEKLAKIYAEVGADKWKDKKKFKIEEIEVKLGASAPRSVDIALFGRFMTSDAFKDIEATVQVAHAIATHQTEAETDYFTAFDDHANQTAHIGDTEFNSCVYYKYFNLNWEGLKENLGLAKQSNDNVLDIARKAALALVEAAIVVQPSGKRNGFAQNSLPDLVLVEVRERNLPVNYANAFAKPARENEKDDVSLMDDSVKKFSDHIARIKGVYNLNGASAFFAVQDWPVPGAEDVQSLDGLKAWLAKQLTR